MANEWKKVELLGVNNSGDPIRYTIADGASVSMGSPLQLLDPRTASSGCRWNKPIAGIAAEDHLANVGVTAISCWTNGIFEAVASLAFGVGEPMAIGGQDNTVLAASGAATAASLALILGRALEDGDAAETINVRLRL